MRSGVETPTATRPRARADLTGPPAERLEAEVVDLTANGDALLDLAERNPAGRLGAAIAAWSQRHEDPDTIRARQHEARSLSWRTEPDGTVLLTPEVAGAVCASSTPAQLGSDPNCDDLQRLCGPHNRARTRNDPTCQPQIGASPPATTAPRSSPESSSATATDVTSALDSPGSSN